MITLNIDLTDDIDAGFYLKVLVTLAKGDDGQIDAQELAFIRAQADLLAVDVTPYLDDGSHAIDFTKPIDPPSRETALAIVRDGVALGYINGDFRAEQKDVLYAVALSLGLTRVDVDAVEEWLKEFWTVLKKGDDLLHNR